MWFSSIRHIGMGIVKMPLKQRVTTNHFNFLPCRTPSLCISIRCSHLYLVLDAYMLHLEFFWIRRITVIVSAIYCWSCTNVHTCFVYDLWWLHFATTEILEIERKFTISGRYSKFLYKEALVQPEVLQGIIVFCRRLTGCIVFAYGIGWHNPSIEGC